MFETLTPSIGNVFVHTTSNRGATPEELAERALDKILHVSDSAPELLKSQALAYREALRSVLITYMHEAIRADRATLKRQLELNGQDTSFLGE